MSQNISPDPAGQSFPARAVLLLGSAAYGMMLFMALLFYKERVVMFDTAFVICDMAIFGDLAIQVNRFGSALTQYFALIPIKLNLPLKAVAMSYSAGFIVLYFSLFLGMLLWLKNTRMALVLLLFNTMMVTHSFYWIQCEGVQGAAFTLFYLAMVERALSLEKPPLWFWLLSLPMIVTIAFFYPLLPIIVMFVLAFYALHYRRAYGLLAAVAVAMVLMYGVKSLFFNNWYDQNLTGELMNRERLFPGFRNLLTVKQGQRFFQHHYYFVPLILLAGTAFYIWKKQWLKLALVWAFCAGFAYLEIITYPWGPAQYYIESQYLIFSIFVSLPLLYDLLTPLRNPRIMLLLLSLIVAVGIGRMYNTHGKYSNRLQWYRNLMQETAALEHKKCVVAKERVPRNLMHETWGSAFEIWLLSTLEQGESRSLVLEDKEGDYAAEMEKNKVFITRMYSPAYADLNRRYFMFNDTSFYVRY